ncbi:cytochrome P450 [Podospora conica]|nr:cytochrome P450 [Schizothecium conicum]
MDSAYQVSLLGVAALAVWYVTTAFLSWWRMRHIPGPFLASFSYLWLASVQRSGRMGEIYRDLPAKYGPVVRIGPNEVTTSDAPAIRKLNAARSKYIRDPWYKGGRWNPYVIHLFNTLEQAPHDALKGRLLNAYSGKDVEGLEGLIDEQIKSLLDLVRRKSEANHGKVDMAALCSYYTLDVITRVGTGEAFGFLRTDSDVFGFIAELKGIWGIMGLTLDIPWLRNILYGDTFLRFFGPTKKDQSGFGKLMRLASDIVERRFAAPAPDQKDMLSSFIRNGFSQTECELECVFTITAGSDNTATSIRITLLNVISNPRVYLRLKREIAEAIREGRASNPVTIDEAKALPYLRAVMYEGLRMRAPTPGLFLKTVPPEGDRISGKSIPAGVGVGTNTSAVLASRELFGEDADAYRPERFLEVSDERRAEMERDVEVVFGYGRWVCMGKNIVWLELYKVLFELFRHFDFQIANATKPWDSESWQVWVESNFWVLVSEAKMEY